MVLVSESGRSARRPRSGWRFVPAVLIAIGLAAAFAFGLDSYLSFEILRENREAIVAWAAAHAVLGAVAFISVYALVVTLSLPGAAWLTISGGFLFGIAGGAFYAMAGAMLGAVALFLAARHAFAEVFRARVGGALHRMEEGFRANALSYLLFLRLVPLFPFWLVNLVPALLGVRLWTFTLGTFIGIIPGTLVFASVGNGLGAVLDRGEVPDLRMVFEPGILGPMIGLAVLALVPVFYKWLKPKGDGGR